MEWGQLDSQTSLFSLYVMTLPVFLLFVIHLFILYWHPALERKQTAAVFSLKYVTQSVWQKHHVGKLHKIYNMPMQL